MTEKPLSGIRIIDLTRVLAGPFCTMVLKHLGAEIIKIEVPGNGDDARQFGPFIDDNPEKSAYFYSINCGKKSVSLNLKTAHAKTVLADLIKTADVLIENYRPGTLERLGFSDQEVKKINPAIIHASASGFGHSGPESQKPAYDSIIQALSGIISITGTEEGETVRVGTSISDIITGMYTAIGIVSALFRREKTGQTARVDVAMLDSAVSVLENAIARYQVSGEIPGPIGSRHPSITPFESFKTRDSEIMIAAGNDKLFTSVCMVIEKPELASDNRFKTNLARTENHLELKRIIENILTGKPSNYWLEILSRKKVPCARINNMKDLFEYDQLKERNMLLSVEGESGFKVAGNPIKFINETDYQGVEKAPLLGEHTETVLKDLLGYSDEIIASLHQNKAI